MPPAVPPSRPPAVYIRRWAAGLSLACLLPWAGGCSLPPLKPRPASEALAVEASRDTPLGQGAMTYKGDRQGKSGIHALDDAHDAFAARMLLARAATHTLDVQYYIWRDDMTGTLLLEALHEAADRGVRVRLLLDDNGTNGLDRVLAALHAHPNIEVRLFNPFTLRWPKMLGFVTDFSRLNRRMHNKSFTADNQATIVGGRNVGDEYFGAGEDVLFADLDVLAIGPVVREVSEDFDRYWASESAYPVDQLIKAAPESDLQDLAARASVLERDPAAAAYMKALEELPFIQQLVKGELQVEWAVTHMVSDDPAKVLGDKGEEGNLPDQLRRAIGDPTRGFDLVSPYFVPTESGVAAFAALVEQGVRIRVLTNALEATDVPLVHSGYAKRRKALLRAGVELYEMRASNDDTVKIRGKGRFGSSGSSLHAKTFAVDGERLFVGSFNFDPRSFNLNTELGFLIDSPAMAQEVSRVFDTGIPQAAYSLRLEDDDTLVWLEQRDGVTVRHTTEPGTTVLKRLGVDILSLLPLEPML